MSKNKAFAVHARQILKESLCAPCTSAAYQLSKALGLPGIYELGRGERSISADTVIRLGKYFGFPTQFRLNLQNDYDLRLAESTGAGNRY